jgi:hypothetical protein
MPPPATDSTRAFPLCQGCGAVPTTREEEACRFCGTVLSWSDFDLLSRKRVVLRDASAEVVDAALWKVETSPEFLEATARDLPAGDDGPILEPLAAVIGVICALGATWLFGRNEGLGVVAYVGSLYVVEGANERLRGRDRRGRGKRQWAAAICVLELGPPETLWGLRPRRVRRVTARLTRQRTRRFKVGVSEDLHAGDVGLAHTLGHEIVSFDRRMHLSEDVSALATGPEQGGDPSPMATAREAGSASVLDAEAPAHGVSPAASPTRDFPLCGDCGSAPSSRGEEACRFCGAELSWEEFDRRSQRQFDVHENRDRLIDLALSRAESSRERQRANRPPRPPSWGEVPGLKRMVLLTLVSFGGVASVLQYLQPSLNPRLVFAAGLLLLVFLIFRIHGRVGSMPRVRKQDISCEAIAVLEVGPLETFRVGRKRRHARTIQARLPEGRTAEFTAGAREDLEPGDVGLAYVVGERIRRFVLTKHIPQE